MEEMQSKDADRFPVVLAAPRHFHLFFRDENDHWEQTIENINQGTYDALKLKRVSFYMDVGLPYGNVMAFGFDGSMIVPRNPHLRSGDDALDEFNRVLATCLLGGLLLEQVAATDLAFGTLLSTGYYRYEQPHGPGPRLRQAIGERSAGSHLTIELLTPQRILKEAVTSAFAAGRAVLAAITRVNAAGLIMAFSYHRSGEYRNSLIQSWVIVEQLVTQIWEDIYLKSTTMLIFQERAGNLNASGRSVSAKIEFLTQALMINQRLYQHLNHARKARNDFIHKGTAPTERASYFALSALTKLIETLCSHQSVRFDGRPLMQSVGRGARRPMQAGVMRAEDADWPRVGWWRSVAPLPGERGWTGEYETLRDIQLMRVVPPAEGESSI